MNEDQMIDNLIAQLDAGMKNGVGHVNVDVDENAAEEQNVETMGCVDCSKNAFSCSIPTMQEGMDRS